MVTFRGQKASVLRYEPLCSGMCDTTIQLEDGSILAVGSREVKYPDGKPYFRDRLEVLREAHRDMLSSLRIIRDQHIRDFNRPWPGCNFAKAILGNAINGAISETESRI